MLPSSSGPPPQSHCYCLGAGPCPQTLSSHPDPPCTCIFTTAHHTHITATLLLRPVAPHWPPGLLCRASPGVCGLRLTGGAGAGGGRGKACGCKGRPHSTPPLAVRGPAEKLQLQSAHRAGRRPRRSPVSLFLTRTDLQPETRQHSHHSTPGGQLDYTGQSRHEYNPRASYPASCPFTARATGNGCPGQSSLDSRPAPGLRTGAQELEPTRMLTADPTLQQQVEKGRSRTVGWAGLLPGCCPGRK